jgi:hypothetical protein
MSGRHTTISAGQVREAARAAGATELDVRRTLLGLPVAAGVRARILAALTEQGLDAAFLDRLAGPKPGAATASITVTDRTDQTKENDPMTTRHRVNEENTSTTATDDGLTGPQILAQNMRNAFATDANPGASAGPSPAAGEEDDVEELPPHIVARRKAQAAQASLLAKPLPKKKVATPGPEPKTMRVGPLTTGEEQ